MTTETPTMTNVPPNTVLSMPPAPEATTLNRAKTPTKRARKAKSHGTVVAAQSRAAIMSFFLAHVGSEFSVGDVSNAVKLTSSVVGKHLNDMAGDGVLTFRQAGTKKFYGMKDEKAVTSVATRKTVTAAATALPPKAPHPSAKDVEIVVFGYQITTGRNPVTGKRRIIIEEAE